MNNYDTYKNEINEYLKNHTEIADTLKNISRSRKYSKVNHRFACQLFWVINSGLNYSRIRADWDASYENKIEIAYDRLSWDFDVTEDDVKNIVNFYEDFVEVSPNGNRSFKLAKYMPKAVCILD